MKRYNEKHLIGATILILAGFLFAGCHYLDVDPELGITEEEVFSTYSNMNTFLSTAYDANGGKNKINITLVSPFYMDLINPFYFAWVATTDAADAGRLLYAQQNFKQGFLTQEIITRFTNGTEDNDKPMITACFGVIRIANKVISNFDMITNGTEKERNDLLGQAYFLRGVSYFNLARWFGGMPYIDYVIGSDDEWDLPRLSAYETYLKAAEDLKTSYDYFEKAGIMRRNTPENLAPSQLLLWMPSGCIAAAVRARCLLYAASPLNNEKGDADWIAAAEACGEALDCALNNAYDLQPLSTYTNNYTGAMTTNEVLWGYYLSHGSNSKNFCGWLSYCQSKYTNIWGSSGVHPTQNFVDRFETKDGYLLRTEEERAIAIAAGSYNEQRPYANRDPRLDMAIIHDGSPAFGKAVVSSSGGVFNIYYDPATNSWPTTTLNSTVMSFGADWGSKDSGTRGETNTGYYCRRYWDGSFSGVHPNLDPMFRLGEMYLAYAEAVNEAYGPNGKAGGMEITALEALNKVRNRVEMPAARSEYVGSKEAFRNYVRNERCVELAYESAHYYFDIRRWKIAPETMKQTLYGMYVEKCSPSAAYPDGKKFVRRAIPSNRQCTWKDYMYVLPLPDSQANTMKDFVNNQKWQ